ncbi:SDR family NAD(P)-dependent oxidoreductase [Paenibacillus sp. Soil787]|uniref:SDR family NAD(P)-dependent oxidoreductase n=1 Tax=Paenibacillus sp. Soil787 TaxID=1736411 RepID=UPI0007025693|nr:glucose 1-dehydrogenase [Paenibacillus sp. Soil787]KRF18412.1 short-chain dehydrogenase [Paenibacillus sp. Soil787]
MRFSGKTVIVTGGGSGIGRTVAVSFAKEGASVTIADLNPMAAMETVDIIRTEGGSAISVETDVTNEQQIIHMVHTTLEHFGALDVLVNNAAMIMPKTVEQTSAEEWDRIFQINTKSVFLCSKYGIPELRKTRGRIVNVASLNGMIGQKGNTAYASTKGAVIAMTKAMAVDYAREGIRINCVCPAGVATPLLEGWLASVENREQARKDQAQSHLLGYIATPEEIAKLVLFLASEDASFITGQAVIVDGGASLGYGAGPKAEWETIYL